MKDSFRPGLTLTRRLTVDDSRAISFMGEDARVYATPAMVSDIEYACRDLLVEHCETGEDSVGIHVDIVHLAATPLGYEVEVTVTVNALEGRKVTFDCVVRDTLETVGKGRHTRFVVATAKTVQRLRDKKARLAAQSDRANA